MRILQLVKGLDIGNKNGGAELFGLQLSRYLHSASEGISVTVCAFYRHGTSVEADWEQRLQQEGLPLFYAARQGQKNLWAAFRTIQRFCATQKFEIAHSHFQVGSLAAAYLKLSRPAPHILRTAHISKEWGDGALAWAARQIFTPWIFPLVMDAQVGVSRAIVSQIEGYPGTRLGLKIPTVIYNGIQPELAAEAEQALQGRRYEYQPGQKFVIGSVGRLTRRKGYDVLLEAFARLLLDLPQATLVLAGDGEERQRLHDQALALGIANRTEFAGQVSHPLELMKRMDLFVLPSTSEGLPTVILEAMACGTPVVATDIPGTNELVKPGETGWLALPSNPESLAQALLAAIRAPEERRQAAARAANLIAGFTYQAAARQYLALYHRLLQ